MVQAQQAVDLAQLNVKLYSNDFTPAQTLSAAKVTLANAQRSLDSAGKNAATALSSAYQAAANAQQLLAVAFQKEANAQTSYAQNQLRLKSGLISSVDLLASQLALAQAQQGRVQAPGERPERAGGPVHGFRQQPDRRGELTPYLAARGHSMSLFRGAEQRLYSVH